MATTPPASEMFELPNAVLVGPAGNEVGRPTTYDLGNRSNWNSESHEGVETGDHFTISILSEIGSWC